LRVVFVLQGYADITNVISCLILGYLYSFSKEAGKTVADKAKQIGKSVEDKVCN
jgi:hypothetical protein